MGRKNKFYHRPPATTPIKTVAVPSATNNQILMPHIISKQDMERIREEEIYREEIKSLIKKPETLIGKFNAFASTPFVLCIFTLILSNFVPFTYTYWVSKQAAEVDKQASISKLKQELKARLLNAFLGKLKWEEVAYFQERKRIGDDPHYNFMAPRLVPRIAQSLKDLILGESGADGAYDEFKDVSTRKLIMRLKLILKKDDAPLVQELNNKMESLKTIIDKLESSKLDENAKVGFMLQSLEAVRDLYEKFDKDDPYPLQR